MSTDMTWLVIFLLVINTLLQLAVLLKLGQIQRKIRRSTMRRRRGLGERLFGRDGT